MCSGKCIPFLRDPFCGKVDFVHPLPICIIDDPIVVFPQLAAMFKHKVLCRTRHDLHVFGHLLIKSGNQCIDRVLCIERATSFRSNPFAGILRTCHAGTKDRRDASLDHRIVVAGFRRCCRQQAYAKMMPPA